MFNVAIAALLVLSALVAIPGNTPQAKAAQDGSYTFTFVHTDGSRTTLTDNFTESWNVFVPGAGGSSVSEPTGLTIHMSCSDTFADGWGSEGGPVEGVDTEWKVFSYYIVKAQGDPCGTPPALVSDIDVDKATNGEDADSGPGPIVPAGDPITWTYTVTNTGTMTLHDVEVTDDDTDGAAISCTGQTNGSITLDPGESIQCEASSSSWYSRTHKLHENTATAVGNPLEGDSASDTDPSHYTPSLVCPFEATGDDILIDIFGATGGYMLGAASFTPNELGPIDALIPAGTYRVRWASYDAHSVKGHGFQPNEQWYLDIGGATSADTDDIASDSDFAQGVLASNLIVGSAASSVMVHHGGPADTINSVIAICALLDPLTPGIDIEKATNGDDADVGPGPSVVIGSAVTWTYVVTNTGSVDLSGVIVTDDILGDICSIGDLGVGESETCEAVGAATLGQYANIGTVEDNNGDGSTVTDTDPSHYLGETPQAPKAPDIDIEKSTNGEDADAAPGPSITVGDPVTWTYVVTNTGEIDLSDVVITDDILGDVCTIDDLAVGASDTCELKGVAEAGQYANIGTATVTAGEEEVTDTDPSHYFGQEVAASATIGDFVWNDENGDGVQDAGEKGIAGAKVKLTLPDGTTAEAVTNSNGLYLFSALEAGTYKAELILSSIPDPAEGSNEITTPSSFTIELAEDESYLDADFGVVAELPKTGLSTDSLTLIALALMLVGAVAIIATRRQSGDAGTDNVAA